jgi:hypothetical protein
MAPLICWSFSSSMFRYLLVDHAVPAMCRSLAAARLSPDSFEGFRQKLSFHDELTNLRVKLSQLGVPALLSRAAPSRRTPWPASPSPLASKLESGSHGAQPKPSPRPLMADPLSMADSTLPPVSGNGSTLCMVDEDNDFVSVSRSLFQCSLVRSNSMIAFIGERPDATAE